MKKNKRWTKEEEDLVSKKYVELGDELAKLMNRTVGAIRERASFLGVAHRKVGGKRERKDDGGMYNKKFVPKPVKEDVTLEEYERYNREFIKSLSFRYSNNGKEGTKTKYFY